MVTTSPTKAPSSSSIDYKIIIIASIIVGVFLFCGFLYYVYRTYYQQRQQLPSTICEENQKSSAPYCTTFIGENTDWFDNPSKHSEEKSDSFDRYSTDYLIDVQVVAAISEAVKIRESMTRNPSQTKESTIVSKRK